MVKEIKPTAKKSKIDQIKSIQDAENNKNKGHCAPKINSEYWTHYFFFNC